MGDVKLIVEKRHLKVVGLAENDIIKIVDYAGVPVYIGTDHEVDLNSAGVYIVRIKGMTLKLHIK